MAIIYTILSVNKSSCQAAASPHPGDADLPTEQLPGVDCVGDKSEEKFFVVVPNDGKAELSVLAAFRLSLFTPEQLPRNSSATASRGTRHSSSARCMVYFRNWGETALGKGEDFALSQRSSGKV